MKSSRPSGECGVADGPGPGGRSCVLVLPVSISRKLGEVGARGRPEESGPPGAWTESSEPRLRVEGGGRLSRSLLQGAGPSAGLSADDLARSKGKAPSRPHAAWADRGSRAWHPALVPAELHVHVRASCGCVVPADPWPCGPHARTFAPAPGARDGAAVAPVQEPGRQPRPRWPRPPCSPGRCGSPPCCARPCVTASLRE